MQTAQHAARGIRHVHLDESAGADAVFGADVRAADFFEKSAFVAVIGRPSVGKSSLVNRICGGKVSIVSAVPQTTRNAIKGILSAEEGQLVFIDTPGRHISDKKFNKKMIEVSDRALEDADLILYVIDVSRPPGPEEEALCVRLAPFSGRIIIALNKIDLPSADSAAALSFLAGRFPGINSSIIHK
ncbi:MAG: GTPase Era, partial [Kiritimatiellaeota bacterium]|nr:GTPase Era [Kiritimatiellota bacterium]